MSPLLELAIFITCAVASICLIAITYWVEHIHHILTIVFYTDLDDDDGEEDDGSPDDDDDDGEMIGPNTGCPISRRVDDDWWRDPDADRPGYADID